MPQIHATAVVEESAKIASDVSIGPFCVVGAGVELAEGVRLHSHVVVEGDTKIGRHTEVFPFASLGHAPQDLKYKGETSRLEIGCNNKIREHVTMNPGTEGGGLLTKVGDGCLFMIGAHVAHDCKVGNGVIMANNATIAGHVEVGDFAILGGLSAVHQFVRIGAHAMIGGMSGIEQDVIPYGLAMGERASLHGLNLVGLKRRGFSREEIQGLRAGFERLFEGAGTLGERVETVRQESARSAGLEEVLSFILADSSRRICQPRR